jgi:hypothetical protein
MGTAAPDRTTPRWAFPLLVAALLVAWTLLCAGAWLLLEAGSTLLDAASGWLAAWPEVLGWAQWTRRLLETSGAWLLAIAWAFGMIGVAVGAWIGRRLWRSALHAVGAVDPRTPQPPVAGIAAPGEGIAAHPPLPDGRRPAND